MRSIFIFFILCVTSFFIAVHFNPSYSDFSSDKKYQLQGSGYLTGKQSIYDSTLTLYFGANEGDGNNIYATLDSGTVTVGDDNYYLNSSAWQTTPLRDGKYLVLTGNAQDSNGNTIHLNLFGKLIINNQEGSMYSITGKITGTETMIVTFSAKTSLIIISAAPPQANTPQQTPPQPQPQPQTTLTVPENQTSVPSNTPSPSSNVITPKILLIAKQTSPVQIRYTYSINVKVFYADQNPTATFDQFYGVVPNAKITAQILDSNNKTVKSFEGLTDDRGYYFYNFRIPDNFLQGSYTLHVMAQIDHSLDNKTLTLFVRSYNN